MLDDAVGGVGDFSLGDAASSPEGFGSSIARAVIDGNSGAGTFVPFRDSSVKRRSSIDDGESCSSTKLKSRTFGSDTKRSRLGGD